MKRMAVIALLVAALVATPRPADAGFKSAMKKVGHVAKETIVIIGVTVAVITFCSSGACN